VRPLTRRLGGRSPARQLTTVVFIDIVGSTEQAVALGDRRWRQLLSSYHGLISKQLKRFGGREVDRAGDGVFATFREPARAVECASTIVEAVDKLNLQVRVGIHTGEVEVSGSSLGGIAVHVGARITSVADAGEILVSSVVHDLMTGSDVRFEDRGRHHLKGVPVQSHLFSVQAAPTNEPSEEPRRAPSQISATRTRPLGRRIIIPVVALAVAITTAVVVVIFRGSASAHHRATAAGLPGFTAPDNSVVQINPSSGRVKTRVTGLVADPQMSDARHIEVGEGGVWVDTAITLQHIDPRRGAVVAQIHAQPAMSTIAIGQGAIWAGGNIGVTRISPATDKVEATIPYDTGAALPTKIAVAGGDVWLLVSDGRLLRIDAGTNRIARLLQTGTTGWDLAVTPHALWILDQGAGQVVEIDSKSAHVLRRIPLGGNLARMVVGSGKIWVLDADAGVVTPIDPASGAVQSPVRVGRGPVDMVYGLGAVWVANRADGSITRIDPQLLTTTTIRAPKSIAAIAVDPGSKTLWVYLTQRADS
jgi:class 3 adenylate cyclase/streptogramin lyase